MNLLDLMIKIGVNDQASSVISGVTEKTKSALGTAAKVAGAATAAGAAGAVAIGKSALDAYANYEQLVGGVDKLYGSASKKLQQYAQNAYKTSGMSANQYMETATQFSASMTSALGGNVQKSADQTDKAMRAISDNVNVFGSNMEDVTNAFKGFSKQNYTMLDNLKLGYGGTKEEMQRLLDDAQKISGVKYNIDSLSDITDAIDVMQQKMGIAGTTTKEAGLTIEGSMNATKASWDNLITAIGNPDADLSQVTKNLMDSLFGTDEVNAAGERLNVGLVGNVVPRIIAIGQGLAQEAPMLASSFFESISGYFATAGPSLSESVTSLFAGIGEGLPDALSGIGEIMGDLGTSFMEVLPSIAEGMSGLFDQLMTFLSENAPMITEGLTSMFTGLGETLTTILPVLLEGLGTLLSSLGAYIGENMPAIMESIMGVLSGLSATFAEQAPQLAASGMQLIQGLVQGFVDGLPALLEQAPTIIANLVAGIGGAVGEIVPAALNIIMTLAGGLISAIPTLIAAIPSLLGALVSAISSFPIAQEGMKLVRSIASGIGGAVGTAVSAITSVGSAIVNFVMTIPGRVLSIGHNIVSFLGNAISSGIGTITSAASSIGTGIINTLTSIPGKVISIGSNVIHGIWNGISNAKDWLFQQVQNIGGGIVDTIKGALGIHSPSRVMRDQVGKNIVLGLAEGLNRYSSFAEKAAAGLGVGVEAAFGSPSLAVAGAAPASGSNVTFNLYYTGDTPDVADQVVSDITDGLRQIGLIGGR